MPVVPPQQSVLKKKMLGKRSLNTVFKVLVALLLVAVLYVELSSKNNLRDIAAAFWRQTLNANVWWLFAACLLIPFNWLAEVQKWRPFVVRFEPMSQAKALRAVLAGASFALFTPNRVGEYGGRVLFVRPENQWAALMANAVGNFGQYLILLTGGAAGGFWLAAIVLGWDERWLAGSLFAAGLLLAGLYYFYFNIWFITPLARRLPLLRRFQSYFQGVQFLEQISRRELVVVLAWSAFRYAVYSTQYFLLLQFFDIKTGITAGYAGIATIFVLQTVVPLPALAGLLVRGGLAVFVWAHFGANEVSSLAVTFVLWIINLILPALLGTFSLFTVNITKSLGYDDD